MMGLKVAYYCPVCDDMKHEVFGITKYVNMRGNKLVHLKCKDCGTELFVEVIDGKDFYKKENSCTDGFNRIIDEIFNSGKYKESDTREYIEKDVIDTLIKRTSEMGVHRHMLEIQKYILIKENTFFKRDKNRLKSYVIAEQKVSHNIDDKYICHRQDAEYDCTIFY